MWIDLRNSAGNLVPVTSTINGNLLIISPNTPLTKDKHTVNFAFWQYIRYVW